LILISFTKSLYILQHEKVRSLQTSSLTHVGRAALTAVWLLLFNVAPPCFARQEVGTVLVDMHSMPEIGHMLSGQLCVRSKCRLHCRNARHIHMEVDQWAMACVRHSGCTAQLQEEVLRQITESFIFILVVCNLCREGSLIPQALFERLSWLRMDFETALIATHDHRR